MDGPINSSILKTADSLRRRIYSPVELVQAYLNRIETYEPVLNTFRIVLIEQALEAARQVEREWHQGFDRGPLHGIPVTLKDNIALTGVPMTNGSAFTSFIPTKSAPVVKALTEAGSVIVGKTHMSEFAYGDFHPVLPAVRNPWHPGYLPGGSSSGAAAGIAAGFALGALGTDTAGSVRVPACFCGTVGFKPTFGRLSLRGITPLAPSLDHVGILAGSCTDTEILFQVLTNEVHYRPEPRPIRKLRFGILESCFEAPTDPETAKAVWETLEILRREGAELISLRPLDLPIALVKQTTWTILLAEAYRIHKLKLKNDAGFYGRSLISSLEKGQEILPEEYACALAWREQAKNVVSRLWDLVDAIVIPTCPWAARPLGSSSPDGKTVNGEFTPFDNLWGLPALSVPVGYTREGLPIGMQITCQAGADELVLAIGKYIEGALNGTLRKPSEALWTL
ncbi:amidase [Brevibacillus sp. NRS-1366]|uniref:amidase n=1 Tax=Brevibacillus sp. NRS-1366 TaxID=3233899 RepID=UPI003D19796F